MSVDQAENINQLWAAVIVEELARQGITYYYISPGSRSTPLTIAAARNERASTHICYDERRAAFMALGYARATSLPAVLICTSGTAAANYYPAVIEAASEQLPLIVLSADRPPELRGTGANQTIDQQSLFGRYASFFMDLPAPDTRVPLRYLLRTIDDAVFQTRSPHAGVAHLNCMFREPLAPAPENIPAAYKTPLKKWLGFTEPFTCIQSGQPEPFPEIWADLQKQLETNPARVLIIGRLNNAAERCAARTIAQKFNGPVFADITSGLRLNADTPNLISAFDLLLLSGAVKQKLQGALFLHIGQKYVSKRLMQYLAEHSGPHIHLSDNRTCLDPALSLTGRLETALPAFAQSLQSLHTASSLGLFLADADQRVRDLIDDRQKNRPRLDEINVARIVSRRLTEADGLFLSSSMPIRDMDMYGIARPDGCQNCAANRGASGIDGVISSALGYSAGLKKSLTLIIGDLAFLHDLTALSELQNHPYPITIILVNNGGGGIFSFLPIADYKDVFEPFFATPHNLSFEQSARQFGVEYMQANTPVDLEQALNTSPAKGPHRIIEVRTSRADNIQLHKTLQQALKDLLDKQ